MLYIRYLLFLVGGLGLGWEIVVQESTRPEVLTALLSVLATAGALKVDEKRKNSNPKTSNTGNRVVKVGDSYVIVDSEGNIVDPG